MNQFVNYEFIEQNPLKILIKYTYFIIEFSCLKKSFYDAKDATIKTNSIGFVRCFQRRKIKCHLIVQFGIEDVETASTAAEQSTLVDSQLAEANSEMDLCGASMDAL